MNNPKSGIIHERIKTITRDEKTTSNTLLLSTLKELSSGSLLILI